MDSFMWACSGSNNECEFDHESVSASSDPNVIRGFQLKDTYQDYDITDVPLTSTIPHPLIRSTDLSDSLDGDCAAENDFSDAVLSYINQVLMEDDLEDEDFMIQDFTLHAAEKSLYEILHKEYPSSPNDQLLSHEDTRSCSSEYRITYCCSNCSSSYITDNYSVVESGIISDLLKYKSSNVHKPCIDCGGLVEYLVNMPLESQSLCCSYHREESDLGGRTNKHLAFNAEESILHELFDKLLSLHGKNDASALNTRVGALSYGESGELQQNDSMKGSDGEMTYTNKRVSKRVAIEMRSVLVQCMQSVADNDHVSASKLLNQIRLFSSPFGDGSERVAHYFANGLEARLVGAGSLELKALAAKSISDADIFKSYILYITAFPFTLASCIFKTQMIMELAEKATSLHIIEFGMMQGLQFLPLIQLLSTRLGGPPKLRITGIDLPQSGFRPAARIKETGCRLANYCERFNVPFEYNSIAQELETVSVEDLRIEKDEVLVASSLFQIENLLDDTIKEHSPRDAVLNLIKRISPDIFIHGVYNGSYSSPFFVSRFREALFHFSAWFDMFEANIPRENQERMVLERDICGKKILNVIACEGLERVVRPETYKQWQIRTLRAGFRQIPLNKEIMKKVKAKVKSSYHKDIFVNEAGQWMLQGWKGRVFFALSCWKPA